VKEKEKADKAIVKESVKNRPATLPKLCNWPKRVDAIGPKG
jgi:hypothetical protein